MPQITVISLELWHYKLYYLLTYLKPDVSSYLNKVYVYKAEREKPAKLKQLDHIKLRTILQDSWTLTSSIIVIHSTRNMCLEITRKQMMWTEFLYQCTVIISLHINEATIN